MLFRYFNRDLTVLVRPNAPVAPRVSVILPTFARGDGPLQRAIESVLSQSWGDLELIVVDDGSRDATRDVLEGMQKLDSRVIVHRYESNSGLPAVRVNQAALRAKGDLIAYQFDDDVWLGADSLSQRVQALERSLSPAVVYSNAIIRVEGPDGAINESRLGGAYNYGMLRGGNYIANNTVVHHARMFELAGMYDPHIALRRYCDLDLWLRFAAYAEFIWVDADLAQVHAGLRNSLGRDVSINYDRYFRLLAIDRNASLKPDRINEYDVLRMNPCGGMGVEEVKQYYQEEAVPFVAQFNDYCEPEMLQTIGGAETRRLSLYVTKPDFSTSLDVTVGNFVKTDRFGVISYRFAKEIFLSKLKPSLVDTLILYRTVTQQTSSWLENYPERVPVAYLMDDNMLCFHEVGPEHQALAPGSPMHQCIEHQIRSSDVCIGYGEIIPGDMRALNPRTIKLSTNIPVRFLRRTKFDRGEKLRIGVLSGPVRHGVLVELWPIVQAFASKYTDKVEFHFWGIDPGELGGELDADSYYRPFTHHYEQYLERLSEETFDVLLVPLDDRTRAAKSKSPIKLLEGVASGAVCIFTDSLPYQAIPSDCCLKVPNTPLAWGEALEKVIALGHVGRSEMFERARAYALKHYATEEQFYDFMAAMRSIELHRYVGDRAILYCFHEMALGGATLHLIQHAGLMASIGFRVVALAPSAPQWESNFAERWSVSTGSDAICYARWSSGYGPNDTQRPGGELMQEEAKRLAHALTVHRIGLIHFATWSPVMSLVSAFLAVPAVASVHQHYSGSEASAPGFADGIHCSSREYGRIWGRLAQSKVMAQVCPVEDRYFDLDGGRDAGTKLSRGTWRVLVSGTLQARKNQLEAVGALVQLRLQGWDVELDLIGYENFYPEYVNQCRALAAEAGVTDFVHFHGFIDDPAAFYARADALLVAATDESMPQTLLQAMAAGVPVVSTRVGGVSEMIRHRYTGILAQSSQRHDLADALKILFQLSSSARQELCERARRTISVLGRSSYVKLKLTDLYLDAIETFKHRFASIECADKEWAPQTLGRMRQVVMERGITCSETQRHKNANAEIVGGMDKWAEQLETDRLAGLLQQLSVQVSGVKPRRRSHINLSENFRSVPYLEYVMPATKRRLSGLTLAIYWPFGATIGLLGVEVVTNQQGVVAQEFVHARLMKNPNALGVKFREPLPPMSAPWFLRVFARDVPLPVHVIESRHRNFSLWRGAKRPVVRVESA